MESEQDTINIRKLLRITKPEIIVIVLLLTIAVCIRPATQFVLNSFGNNFVIETIEASYSNASIFIEDTPIQYATGVFGWALAGSLAYLALWTLFIMIKDLGNDIAISSVFKHAQSFHQSDFWGAIIVRWLAQTMAFVSMVCFVLLSYKLLFAIQDHIRSNDLTAFSAILRLLLLLALCFVGFHIVVIFYRALFGHNDS